MSSKELIEYFAEKEYYLGFKATKQEMFMQGYLLGLLQKKESLFSRILKRVRGSDGNELKK